MINSYRPLPICLLMKLFSPQLQPHRSPALWKLPAATREVNQGHRRLAGLRGRRLSTHRSPVHTGLTLHYQSSTHYHIKVYLHTQYIFNLIPKAYSWKCITHNGVRWCTCIDLFVGDEQVDTCRSTCFKKSTC